MRQYIVKFTKAYVRRYTDNQQTVGYVEWVDNNGKAGRTEGDIFSLHMKALFARARREGLTVEHQTW